MDSIAAQEYPALFLRQVILALDVALAAVRSCIAQGDRAGHDGAQEDLVQENLEQEDAVERALEILRYALKVPAAWPAIRALLLILSPKLEKDGRWSEWIDYLQAGADLAEQLGDQTARAELMMWRGVFYRSLGDYPAARQYLGMSADVFLARENMFQYATALNRLAWCERLDRNFERARTLANHALAHLTKNTTDVLLERARCFSILGAVVYDQGHVQEAEEYFRRALQIPALANEKPRLAWGYADLGLSLSAQGKYDEALKCYQSASEVLASIHAPIQAAVMQLNLAGIYLATQKPEAALELCFRAGEVMERVKDLRRLIMIETNIGIAHRQLAQHDQAKEVFHSAIQRAEKLGHLHLLVNALQELGLVYMECQAYQEAIAAFQRALAHLHEMEESPRKEAFRRDLCLHLQQAHQEVPQQA